MEIRKALMSLDSMDNDLWTEDGSPRLDAVSALLGRKVTRREIISEAPHFSRTNNEIEGIDEEVEEVEEEGEEVSGSEYKLKSDNFLDFLIECPMIPRDQLESVEKQVKDIKDQFDLQAKKLMALSEEMSRFIGPIRQRIHDEFPNGTNQEAIKEYLASQQKVRESRAMIGLLSPIDASLRARHNPRPRMR